MRINFKILAATVALASFWAGKPPKSVTDIFAPVVVGTPPSDAYIGLSLMDDGEIRHYNYGEQKESELPLYISSVDSGLTWKTIHLPHDIPYADTRSPISGEYIRATHSKDKVYIIRTKGGIDGDRTITKIDDNIAIMLKPPVFADGGKRVIIAGHGIDRKGCFTYVSTDDGVTWQKSNRINTPPHQSGGHHLGTRWNHGAVEPTVIALSDGRLWMIMRTAQDRHWQSFSTDGGLTWCEPTPSPFYGTITMPTLFKLKDGRILFFWTNTTPLPERKEANGVWDDVFTNRDATHVAISEDDGKTWIGMRELYLNDGRNLKDLASSQGIDKSVHQAQAIQLSDDKVMVAVGQNKRYRKILIFDVDWLYEKERNTTLDDFNENWSAFRYYKGIVGHCGYNRELAPLLIDHPDKAGAKALKIGYTPNDTLVQDRDGALWNFPAAKNGELSVGLKMAQGAQDANLILTDHWFNPTDTVSLYQGQYIVKLNRKELKIKDDKWHTLRIVWQHNGIATLYVDNKKVGKRELNNPTQHGVSYLHILGGDKPDNIGVLIDGVSAKVM